MLLSFLFFAIFRNSTEQKGIRPIDPYFTLGLKKSATMADINRAYKRFSEFREKQKNPSKKLKEQMENIQYAYNLIKDNSTKAIYDNYGPKIFNVDTFAIYDYFTDEEVNVVRRLIPEKAVAAKKNGGVIIYPVMFSLKDFMRGCTKNVNILRTIPCVCSQRTNKCRKCRNSPVMSQYFNYKLVLPKGSHSLQRIYAKNITDTTKDRSATDVVFVAYQKPNKQFERRGNDLYSHITVNLSDTFHVQEYKFKNADGRIISFSLNNVKNGDVITIKGKGVPYNANGDVCGDLILTVKVLFPKKLSEKQKEKIKRALPDDVNEYE